MSLRGHAAGTVSPGSFVAGKFLLQRPLGQGGMGAVWLAQHTTLRIPCAVKFLHPSVVKSQSIRARFEREAVAAAQLRSPHVVQVLDHGVWEGAPYIAMELLEGEDLAQRLHRVGRLSPRDTALIVAQVSRALARAHAAGLVHRDLKPANVFLVRDDDREIAKVLDFGVAKLDAGAGADPMTQSGATIGTPGYMSPEQARASNDVDYRSDLWALGVVTFRCLTGVLPFPAAAMFEVFTQIIHEPLPVPSRLAPVPPGFDAWWLQAASRDRQQRFQSARELSGALYVALGVPMGDVAELGARTPGHERGSAPKLPVQVLSGMQALLTPSTVTAPAGAPGPPKSRAGLVVMIGVAVASLLAAGGLVAWRLASRSQVVVESPSTAPYLGATAAPAPAGAAAVGAGAMITVEAATAPPSVVAAPPSASAPSPLPSVSARVKRATGAVPPPRPAPTGGLFDERK